MALPRVLALDDFLVRFQVGDPFCKKRELANKYFEVLKFTNQSAFLVEGDHSVGPS